MYRARPTCKLTSRPMCNMLLRPIGLLLMEGNLGLSSAQAYTDIYYESADLFRPIIDLDLLIVDLIVCIQKDYAIASTAHYQG